MQPQMEYSGIIPQLLTNRVPWEDSRRTVSVSRRKSKANPHDPGSASMPRFSPPQSPSKTGRRCGHKQRIGHIHLAVARFAEPSGRGPMVTVVGPPDAWPGIGCPHPSSDHLESNQGKQNPFHDRGKDVIDVRASSDVHQKFRKRGIAEGQRFDAGDACGGERADVPVRRMTAPERCEKSKRK